MRCGLAVRQQSSPASDFQHLKRSSICQRASSSARASAGGSRSAGRLETVKGQPGRFRAARLGPAPFVPGVGAQPLGPPVAGGRRFLPGEEPGREVVPPAEQHGAIAATAAVGLLLSLGLQPAQQLQPGPGVGIAEHGLHRQIAEKMPGVFADMLQHGQTPEPAIGDPQRPRRHGMVLADGGAILLASGAQRRAIEATGHQIEPDAEFDRRLGVRWARPATSGPDRGERIGKAHGGRVEHEDGRKTLQQRQRRRQSRQRLLHDVRQHLLQQLRRRRGAQPLLQGLRREGHAAGGADSRQLGQRRRRVGGPAEHRGLDKERGRAFAAALTEAGGGFQGEGSELQHLLQGGRELWQTGHTGASSLAMRRIQAPAACQLDLPLSLGHTGVP